MKIFTLPSWYKNEKHPENSIFIYEQMQAIRALGHQVIVLSVQPKSILGKNHADKQIKKVDDNGIITYYTEIDVIYPSKFRKIFIIQFKRALEKLICKAKSDYGMPDVYYAHFSFAAGYIATLLNDNIPVVVEEHFSGLMERPDKKLVNIVRNTVENSNCFICVSDGLKKAIYNKTKTKNDMKVVSNMINPCFKFYPCSEKDSFIFFSMGSLIPRKGFDLLIKAFSEEFKKESNVFLRIAGSGSEKEHLLQLISEAENRRNIELVGQLNREQTLKEYINCNCFVLASRAETYGLVYREAMAVGRPIISTKHGGFSDDWNDEWGCLIDVDDIDTLKISLRNIYNNFNKYNLLKISKECLKTCSSDAVALQIVDLLGKCI